MANRTGEVIPGLLDMFPAYVVSRAIPVINQVLDSVFFTSWNAQEIAGKLTQRSYFKIINDGEVNHLYPCIDTAVLATYPFFKDQENGCLRIMTDKGALEQYRNGRANLVHLDCIFEIPHDGILYGFDIGCGDLTLTKLKPDQDPNLEQAVYLTSRPEKHSREWHRTSILVIPFSRHPRLQNNPVLDLLETNENLIYRLNSGIPLGLTRPEIVTCKEVPGKDNPITTNTNFDPVACQEFNNLWTADFNDYWRKRAGKSFPELRIFRYR